MKTFLGAFLLIVAVSSFGRDSGAGSNTTVGPGPATPDAGSSDTSIMGGGTPGNQGAFNLDLEEPNKEKLKKMKQKQEERKSKKSETDTI
jgi:hypothetical protein